MFTLQKSSKTILTYKSYVILPIYLISKLTRRLMEIILSPTKYSPSSKNILTQKYAKSLLEVIIIPQLWFF